MKLLEMLKYRRPEGSASQKIFCNRFLKPVMGTPDEFGNYIHIVGDKPNIAFMAHHDTVHNVGGIQKLQVSDKNIVTAPKSDCLGADCTTGVWLILEMIEAQVPGVYVVHAAEEVGCIGSAALVKSNPDWLQNIDAAISFDRYGTNSIITHQMSRRTASDDFAHSLADTLNLPLEPDTGGSFTDSNEYADIVSECTNVSVGYYNQHTSKESQDLEFAHELRDALICADFSNLVFSRDPSIKEYDDWDYYGSFRSNKRDQYDTYDLQSIVYHFPEEVAELLENQGIEPDDLLEMIGMGPREPRLQNLGEVA